IVGVAVLGNGGLCVKVGMARVLRIVHGGISRLTTFALIDRAQGRASSNVSKDIGAIDPGRWQSWHERCRIGAISLVKVSAGAAGTAEFCAAVTAPRANRPNRIPNAA